MNSIFIACVCLIGLIAGIYIGRFCKEEVKAGKKHLHYALYAPVVFGMLFLFQYQIEVSIMILFLLMIFFIRNSPLVFFLYGLVLLFSPYQEIVGSSLFIYALFAGIIGRRVIKRRVERDVRRCREPQMVCRSYKQQA